MLERNLYVAQPFEIFLINGEDFLTLVQEVVRFSPNLADLPRLVKENEEKIILSSVDGRRKTDDKGPPMAKAYQPFTGRCFQRLKNM